MKHSTLTYIDLFAGAGGLSEGFIRQGFQPIAHVEMDEHACFTLKTRLAYHYLKSERKTGIYNQYLKNQHTDKKENERQRNKLYGHIPADIANSVINCAIGDQSINDIFKKIDSLLENRKVDVIIGGPPCQAYSNIGRSRDPNRMRNDPRNYLFKYYAEFLKRYEPKMFVFENVQGILSAKNGYYYDSMKEAFALAGYHLEKRILQSEKYGVLQTRKRVVIVGWEKDKKYGFPDVPEIANQWQVQDILSDLLPLEPGDSTPVKNYYTDTNDYLKKFNIRNGSNFITQHTTRPHHERDLQIYEEAIEKWLLKRERLNYNDLSEEKKTHKNRKSFLDRFKVVDPFGHSHTMVAHIAKDGHYYIYPDLKQIRSISIREAARIQSFPDDYFFEGGQSAAFRQIGNAVPPLMAEQIAKGVKKVLG
ncbi:MAG: DNA cytosine methyltransferase [Leptospirales bacterium]